MRQTVQSKRQPGTRDAAQEAAGHAGQSIDAWIEAALAEQAKRVGAGPVAASGAPDAAPAAAEGERPKRVPRGRAAGETNGIESLMAATVASERRAVETAAKTAVALGSVASWIERAQERLTETSLAASQAQERTAAVVNGAIGALEQKLETIERKVETSDRPAVTEALKAIERIESRLGAAPAATGAPAGLIEDSLRGFEARMKDLSDRLAGPRPIGRRGPADDVGQAVAEIRSHQAAMESGTARPEPRPGAAPAKNYGDVLSAMRADIARIAGHVDGPRQPALDGLKHEIDGLRASIGELPRREDFGAIERSIASLADEVTTLRREGRGDGTAQLDAIQAEISRIGAAGGSADQAKLTRDIDVLSHKLDIVSASGLDPQVTAAMAAQLDEVRQALDGLAGQREIAMLGQQMADLKRDLATIGKSQIDPDEFASLKGSVEEMRDALSGTAPDGAREGAAVQLARGQLEPIESMLSALAEKLDRVERHVADPDALDQLERQIAGLNTALHASHGRDPAIASLEHSMGDLLREVVSWRAGTVEIAERAARNAVAETLDAWGPSAEPGHVDDYARHLAGLRADYESAEQRADTGLDGVQATLDGVVRRLNGLETRPEPGAAAPAPPVAVAVDGPALTPEPVAAAPAATSAPTQAESPPRQPGDPARRLAHILKLENTPHEADRPLTGASGEEILLEPGERPGGPAAGAAPALDPADIKSSFIAAARRAAQAAAADAAANKGKTARVDAGVETADRTELLGRFRALFEKHRRPLLIGAAAIALALGGFQLTREAAGERSLVAQAPAETAGPAPIQAEPNASARIAPPDPQTTQSLPDGAVGPLPRTSADTAPGAVAPASPAPASEPPAAAQIPAAPAKPDVALDTEKLAALVAPAASATPTRPDPASALAALKAAAAGGNPLALYDLALRMSEGRGVPRDLQLAAAHFEKAAEKGLAPAQYRTGNLYEKGVGVTRDLEAAKAWYKRAAEGGNTRAMHNLAVLIAEGGGKPDYPAAAGWFQRAAEHGVRDSQYNLAVLHARGLGTAQDFGKSYTWFAIAAAQGDEDAGRKRDEVGSKLAAADLTRAKGAAERWRATPSNVAANDVAPPANWSAEAPAPKRQQRDGRG